MLIIEIDGMTHDNEFSHTKDIQREERLTRAGFKIVRFTDEEVLNNMAGVILKLGKVISDMEISTPLIPNPSPAGDIKYPPLAEVSQRDGGGYHAENILKRKNNHQ
jgi:hypothetical protein